MNVPYNVDRKSRILGEYFADLLVEDKIIIEVKALRKLNDEHERQLLNYLRISGCRVGLLINYHPSSLEWQRVVLGSS